MRYTSAGLFGTALLSLSASIARADPIAWYYSWSRTPNVIQADNAPGGAVALSPASKMKTLANSSTIEAANVFHYGSGPNHPPASFGGGAADQFIMTLTIHDSSVPNPGSVTFNGGILGYMTPTVSHIQTFYTGVTTKSLTLGKHLYTIRMSNYSPSAEDCSTGQATAIATVTVQDMPEPTALVLAGLALPAAGLFWRRRHLPIKPPAIGS
jgi:hypothetical protein